MVVQCLIVLALENHDISEYFSKTNLQSIPLCNPSLLARHGIFPNGGAMPYCTCLENHDISEYCSKANVHSIPLCNPSLLARLGIIYFHVVVQCCIAPV